MAIQNKPRTTRRPEGLDIEPQPLLPGYAESFDAFEDLRAHLYEHGSTWNAAWADIVNERFTFNRWLALVAKTADSNWRYARKWLPMRPAAEGPSWLAMTLPGDKTSVGVPSPVLGGSELECTPFCPLSAVTSPPTFSPSAESLGDGLFRITVDVAATRPQAGRYISFAFASGKRDTPALILLLEIIAPPASSPAVPAPRPAPPAKKGRAAARKLKKA